MNLFGSVVLWMTYLISLYLAVYWVLLFVDKLEIILSERKKKVNLTRFPLVTVIIPAFNEEKYVGKTISSVLALNYPEDKIQLIVVNDSSTDQTKKVIEKIISENSSSEIVLINHKKNSGKAQSLNDALVVAKGEFFACLDADSEVHSDTLKKMLSLYYEKNDANIAIITPAMKINSPINLVQKFQRLEYLMFLVIARLTGYVDCISVAPGPFSVYKTEIIRKLGGFDVTNPTEDMEIAYRLQNNNYRIIHCTDAEVYTVPPPTFKGLFIQRRNRWFRGGLVNTFKYKHMILDKKYGDFGVQLLINFSGFLMAFLVLGFFFYFTIRPLYNLIHDFYLVGFDILPYLRNFEFNFEILNLDISTLFVNILLFAFSVFVLYFAHKNAGEKITKHGAIHIVPYFLFYYLFLSVAAVFAVFDHVFKKEWIWGKK